MFESESKIIFMITPDLIKRRLKNFWGYGSLDAPVWFVGMEEGLGKNRSAADLEARFLAADGKATVDMRRDMTRVSDHIRFFRKGAPVQHSWKFPIALYLYLKNKKEPTKQEIQNYQAFELGNSELKNEAALELMPLPAHKANEDAWLYANYGIPGLGSRKEYLDAYKPKRIKELNCLIRNYSPRLIIFYSLTYLPDWIEVMGENPKEVSPRMYFAKNDKTSFCVIPQGVSFGMSYARIFEFARKVSGEIKI